MKSQTKTVENVYILNYQSRYSRTFSLVTSKRFQFDNFIHKKVDRCDILDPSSREWTLSTWTFSQPWLLTFTFAEVKTLRIVSKMTINITFVITNPVYIIINLIIRVELVISSGRSVVLFFGNKIWLHITVNNTNNIYW